MYKKKKKKDLQEQAQSIWRCKMCFLFAVAAQENPQDSQVMTKMNNRKLGLHRCAEPGEE